MKTISYLGPKGTFTEEALGHYGRCCHVAYEGVACPTIDEAIDRAMHGETDFAFVPVENSLGGAVINTMDYLMEHEDIGIVAEVVMPIRHHLWLREQADLRTVSKVFSHPQAFRQCKGFIQEHLGHAQCVDTASTAEAARTVSQSREIWASIGGWESGASYGLYRAASSIQDKLHNMTRFLVVKPEAKEAFRLREGANKLSLLCELDGLRPGSLAECLDIFAKRQINLVRIESRPTKGRLGEYKFFLDLDMATGRDNVESALCELQAMASHFHSFGAYPLWVVGDEEIE